jgi:acyl dehydratase
MEKLIENRTFDELQIGEMASIDHSLTEKDILLFALMSGDVNPAHLDKEYAKNDYFHKIIGHGMWGGSLISTVLGTRLPGPGTIYLSQTLKFLRPVLIGDIITATVKVKEKDPERFHVTFDCLCSNQEGKDVISGTAVVLAPTEKVIRKMIKQTDVEKLLKGMK